MELHVLDTLMAQLCILLLKYLSLVGISVHDVLEVRLGSFHLVNPCLKICRQLNNSLILHISFTTSTPWSWRRAYLCFSGVATCSS
jgi:hypothetical protein